MVATKTASGDLRSSGRISETSTVAPRRNPNAMPMSVARASGTPASSAIHVMYADSVAISPWAKLRCPVPR